MLKRAIFDSTRKQKLNSDESPGGGIGIRASLRCWFPQGIGGSSPLLGIDPPLLYKERVRS